jgi:hypothetical protein
VHEILVLLFEETPLDLLQLLNLVLSGSNTHERASHNLNRGTGGSKSLEVYVFEEGVLLKSFDVIFRTYWTTTKPLCDIAI